MRLMVESILNWSCVFLLWKDEGAGAHFLCSNELHNRCLPRVVIKIFQNIFPTGLNCLYNLCTFVAAAGILHPKPCILFPTFFLVALLPFSYRHGKFCSSSSIGPSETVSRYSVKKGVLKNFANFYWNLFLVKLQAWRLATLLKRDSNTDVFLWNLRNF